MVHKELQRLVDAVMGDDPRAALTAYRDLADRQLPWLEQRVVALARREGLNWTDIGRALGRSRQAVRKRFGAVIARPAPGPRETAFERALRQQNEAYERFKNPQAEEADPIGW